MKLIQFFEAPQGKPVFRATDISHEPDGIMVLVKSREKSPGYYGVNVMFDKNGEVEDLVTGDEIADAESENFRKEIIAAAEKMMDPGDLEKMRGLRKVKEGDEHMRAQEIMDSQSDPDMDFEECVELLTNNGIDEKLARKIVAGYGRIDPLAEDKKDITEAFSPAVVARRAVFKTAVDAIRAAGGKISHGAGKTMFKSEVDRLAALRGDEAPDRTKLTAAKVAVQALLAHKASAEDSVDIEEAFADFGKKTTAADYTKLYGTGTWGRVTYKQEGGDDGSSYVVRVDGQPKFNGLTKRAAEAEKLKQVDAIAKKEKLGKYSAVTESLNDDDLYVVDKKTKKVVSRIGKENAWSKKRNEIFKDRFDPKTQMLLTGLQCKEHQVSESC